jgi:4'-phosphopantetheinyl transferase
MLPPAGTVDVWRIPLDMPAELRTRITACLDDSERRHAERMKLGGERWAVARATRREILSRYSGVTAGTLRFEVGPHGKPRLEGFPAIQFNTSSRSAMALLAMSGMGPVGVDIEREDVPGNVMETARGFLPREDVEAIAATAAAQRARRFAIAWTRYEAVRKLRGLGIDETLPNADQAPRATVRELEAPEGFVAALAAEGDGWSVRIREASEVWG